MTLRTRRIFFWSLIPTFIVGGAFAVSYSQGYRVNPQTREVTKVGALYVRGYPRTAQITLDGEPLNTGSWWPLQNGTLANSLVPGTYRLHGEAPGYLPWDADIVVRPTLVTERKSLVLFPESPAAVPLRQDVSPSAIRVADDIDALVVSDAESGLTHVGDLALTGTYLGTASGRVVTASSQTKGKTVTQTLHFQSPDDASPTTAAYKGTVLGVMDDSAVVRESALLVAAYDAATGARSVIASTSEDAAIGSVLRTSSYDAWEAASETSSTLVIRRRSGGTPVSVAIEGIVSIDAAGAKLGVRDAAGSLWIVDPSTGAKTEVAHRASFASWRPGGEAVAAVIDGALEVIALRQDVSHGTLAGALPAGASPDSISWYPDGDHLFVELGGELLFVDIIDGTLAEQHAYRLPLAGSWAFSSKSLTLYLADRTSVRSYAFPD